ncbi:hypothetical protein INT80_06835 [Gallibacterium anatis]|uniref:Uncharacterized protein n=1 Tax=Gallibacterium anatis TaxID=750 RepID=A0A930URF3_9PAST|nr:hypothetical protein [Gallibacterium anatis]
MSRFKLPTSEIRLVGVHPDLVKVVDCYCRNQRLIFMVVEGKRSKAH